jgi:hypothetical protein
MEDVFGKRSRVSGTRHWNRPAYEFFRYYTEGAGLVSRSQRVFPLE